MPFPTLKIPKIVSTSLNVMDQFLKQQSLNKTMKILSTRLGTMKDPRATI